MVKKKKAVNPKIIKIIVYAFTIFFSIAYILIGRGIALEGYPQWEQAAEEPIPTKVVSIITDESGEGERSITFEAKVIKGEMKGEIIIANQTIRDNYYPVQEAIELGDKVLVFANTYTEGIDWTMLDFMRSNMIIYLGLAFAAAVIAFGRLKGLNTLVSLIFTGLSVFAVFIPAVLSGQNIYIWSIITCVYVIIMTMLFINGAEKKSFAAGMGCFLGVTMAGLLTLFMSWILQLTGMVSEETLYLQLVQTTNPIDLRGIVFAAIIIGALGAIMDVAMDIASSLNELRQNIPNIGARKLIRSGFNIGRDVMGTMANTLILAYIGSSLSTTLLLVAYNVSFTELMNMELIVVELLQALVGSFGILLAIPLTATICALIYPKKGLKELS